MSEFLQASLAKVRIVNTHSAPLTWEIAKYVHHVAMGIAHTFEILAPARDVGRRGGAF